MIQRGTNFFCRRKMTKCLKLTVKETQIYLEVLNSTYFQLDKSVFGIYAENKWITAINLTKISCERNTKQSSTL